MTPQQEYKRTLAAIMRLESAGLFVEIGTHQYSVIKRSVIKDREYDCWINCHTVQELEVLAAALCCAPELLKNPDYKGVEL
jgi:hypothetical protein